MKLKSILTLVLFLSTFLLFGQKTLQVDGNTTKNHIYCGAHSADKVCMVTSGKGYIFEEFDLDGKSQGKLEIKSKELGKRTHVGGGVYFAGSWVFTLTQGAYGKRAYQPKLLVLDLQKGSYSIKEINGASKCQDDPTVRIYKDQLFVGTATEDLAFQTIVFDKNLKQSGNFRQVVKKDGYQLAITSFHITDDHIIMGGLYEEYMNVMACFNRTSKKGKAIDLRINKHLTHVYYSPLANGDILASGLWSNKNSNYANGFCTIQLDANTLKAKDTKLTVFAEDILSKYKLNKDQVVNGKGLKKDFKGRTPIMDSEGNIYVFYEADYYAISSSGNYTEFLEDVVMAKIDGNGKVVWQDIILKKAAYKDGGHFLSFKAVLIDNKLNVFYSDSYKNEGVSNPKDIENAAARIFADLRVYHLEYSTSGKKQAAEILKTPEKKHLYCPRRFEQINGKIFYVEQCSKPVLAGRTTGVYQIQNL